MTPTIQTFSGREINLVTPSISSIHIGDISHALSNLCRYTGHVTSFYSVAQHSYLVSRWCSPENALWGLLHDASEAYLGDVSSPLKHLLQDYRLLEANVMETVCRAFDLPLEEPAEVKHFDLVALATERRDLMPNHQGINWSTLDSIVPSERPITPLAPRLAETLFLNRFYELIDERAKARAA